jgi:hypothetical protein
MRIRWYGVGTEEQEIKTFAYLGTTAHAMVHAGGSHPCAIHLHAVDAYELAAHPRFDASFGAGQILGRFQAMAVILDPDGIESVAELSICPGCQQKHPACYYTAVMV